MVIWGTRVITWDTGVFTRGTEVELTNGALAVCRDTREVPFCGLMVCGSDPLVR